VVQVWGWACVTGQTHADIDWPTGFQRTETRTRCRKFDVTLAQALDDLEAELDRLGVDDYRLSTAAQQRKRDNRPYANANPDDPSAVIRWSMDGEQFAVACDRYTSLRDNVRAIGLYIREKRKMDSRPVTTGESEFANARLPSGNEDALQASPPPHGVLDVAPDAPNSVVEAAAREKTKVVHPDQGGSAEEFQRVQQAKEAMLNEDGGST